MEVLEKDGKNMSLLNKYEAYTPEGCKLSDSFRDLVKDWLIEHSKDHSTIELEYICTNEITGKLAELRIRKALKLRKSESENA